MKSSLRFSHLLSYLAAGVVASCGSICAPVSAQGGTLRDPVLRSLAGVGSVLHTNWYQSLTQIRSSNSLHQVRCLVEREPGMTVDFASVGAEAVVQYGDVYTLFLPTDRIQDLADLTGVRDLRAARLYETTLDESVPVWVSGEPGIGIRLDDPGPGWGVDTVVGVVDTGADATSPFFDDLEDESRIFSSWNQQTNLWSIGRDLDLKDPSAGDSGHPDTDGHGTHVLGIMGGSGAELPPGAYVGVAPGADIAVVGTTFYDADILAGVQHVFTLADERAAPAVVNLSLGGHDGPHDGTDALDRALDELTGPGRIVVCAAGNEGDEHIHADGTVTATGTFANAQAIRYDNGSNGIAAFGIFHDSSAGLNVWLRRGDGSFEGPVAPGGSLDLPGAVIENAPGGADPDNGWYGIHVATWTGAADTNDWQIRLAKVSDEDPDAKMHAWLWYSEGDSYMRLDGDFPGNSDCTVGSPATAFQTLSVGAYVTKADGFGMEGALATFSSRGPTADGRPGVDIVAPGSVIRSACSSQAGGCIDDYYADRSGTSMAAPHVSGLTALLLQQNPTLRPEAVVSILARTARRGPEDPFVPEEGFLPSAEWGYGKADAGPAILLAQELLPRGSLFFTH